MDRSSAFQIIGSYQNGSGFLSDPYKLVQVALANAPDSRPDERNQYGVLARYRRHFSSVTGTLHLDYRFYYDDWKLSSHTVELAWYQSLFDLITIVPSVRYYTQSQAEFYGPFFTTDPGKTSRATTASRRTARCRASSASRRTSPTGPSTWRGSSAAPYERYQSSGSLALKSVELENPALVSFDVFMINLSARF